MKIVKLYKVVKIPLANLKMKMKQEGKYEPALMDVSTSRLFKFNSYLQKPETWLQPRVITDKEWRFLIDQINTNYLS